MDQDERDAAIKEARRHDFNMTDEEFRQDLTPAQRVRFDHLLDKRAPMGAVIFLASVTFFLGCSVGFMKEEPDVQVSLSLIGKRPEDKSIVSEKDRQTMMKNPSVRAAFVTALQKAADDFARTGEKQNIVLPVREDRIYGPNAAAAATP